jgi:hypothetical protein
VNFMLSLGEMEKASLPKIIHNGTSFPLQFGTINKDFEDFKTAISKVIESNLSLLDETPLPKNLKIEELKKYFRNKIKSELQKDSLFEKAIELSAYTKNMYEKMDSYFKEIFDYYEERQKELSSDIFCVSKMFLNSDLPMPFLRSIEDSLLAEKDYIQIYTKRIRNERLSLLRYRNNQSKFKRVCDSHNTWAVKFGNELVELERLRIKLIWYVDFNNSANLNEIFEDKIIKMRLLDASILIDFIHKLENQVYKMEKLNVSMAEPSSFLPLEIDDGTRAIRNMMQLLEKV